MAGLKNLYDQSRPPAPTFTEKQLHDLQGKAMTGGASGVGFELAKLLYRNSGTVYIAGRSKENGAKAIGQIKTDVQTKSGQLEYLHLDLGDLTTIKQSASDFIAREQRLDVLWNNAGVMMPPKGSKTTQGYELQLGTNCLGPFLFTQLLLPLLQKTAKGSPSDSVRVVWTGSVMVDLSAPKGGVMMDDLKKENHSMSQQTLYGQSKCGNVLIGSEFGKLVGKDGIISVSLNPGNLKTPLQRHMPAYQKFISDKFITHDPIYGGYTELFAGLSPDVTMERNGAYIIPWGRFHNLAKVRPDIGKALKTTSEGGDGIAEKFYQWCETETRQYH